METTARSKLLLHWGVEGGKNYKVMKGGVAPPLHGVLHLMRCLLCVADLSGSLPASTGPDQTFAVCGALYLPGRLEVARGGVPPRRHHAV